MEPKKTLSGRTALVTGAGRRLGQVIALALGRAGADVLVHYHQSGEGAMDTVDRLTALGRKSAALPADLSDSASIEELARSISAESGRLDILVHSAADYERLPIAEITPEKWDDMLALNLRGPVLLTRALLPLLARSPVASVISLVDVAAIKPWANHLHYAVSKAGLAAATRSLALELAPGIRVNAVAPGTSLPAEWQTGASLAAIRARTPLRRLATAEEVAAAVVFLASAPASLTGQVIAVDGGLSLT
ncbi:MAG: SDR family oxidoreductase [Candidatus Eisenbacteria bacterium]|nr:SDR family oxidoreductase [Candidatus Eisenbacteria bacterium]